MRIDLTAYRCPQALVQAKLALRQYDQRPLLIQFSDASSARDLCRWLSRQELSAQCCRQGQLYLVTLPASATKSEIM